MSRGVFRNRTFQQGELVAPVWGSTYLHSSKVHNRERSSAGKTLRMAVARVRFTPDFGVTLSHNHSITGANIAVVTKWNVDYSFKIYFFHDSMACFFASYLVQSQLCPNTLLLSQCLSRRPLPLSCTTRLAPSPPFRLAD